MRFWSPVFLALLFVGCASSAHVPVPNPDPNHTHADFAVWIDGSQLDFSAPQYMTTEATETGARQYLHLHDGNGHILHRHKPGLTIGDFFHSIGFEMTDVCMVLDTGRKVCPDGEKKWRMFVNGSEVPYDGFFIFHDGDQLLFTYGLADAAQLQHELAVMTDDACRYSKTCPWRGKPPSEHCIADPKVPCSLQ